MQLYADVVRPDVPFVIGLKVLREQRLLLNYLDDKVEHQPFGPTILVKCKNGHMFIEWETEGIYLIRSKLQCFQIHFLNCTSENLFQLMERNDPLTANPSVKSMLQNI